MSWTPEKTTIQAERPKGRQGSWHSSCQAACRDWPPVTLQQEVTLVRGGVHPQDRSWAQPSGSRSSGDGQTQGLAEHRCKGVLAQSARQGCAGAVSTPRYITQHSKHMAQRGVSARVGDAQANKHNELGRQQDPVAQSASEGVLQSKQEGNGQQTLQRFMHSSCGQDTILVSE